MHPPAARPGRLLRHGDHRRAGRRRRHLARGSDRAGAGALGPGPPHADGPAAARQPDRRPRPLGPRHSPALEAGLFWGAVGAVRELLTRQAADLSPDPWLVWTGGDAAVLAPAIDWTEAQSWSLPRARRADPRRLRRACGESRGVRREDLP